METKELSVLTQQAMDRIAQEYAAIIYKETYAVMQKYNATGNLLRSLSVKFLRATSSLPPVIWMTYDGYANIFEARQPLWTNQPPLSEIIAFVQSRGLAQQGRIPGYKSSAPNLSEYAKAKRIAFAISKDKEQTDKWKRKPWRKRALSSVLKDLNSKTIELFRDEIENIMVGALTN
jgi:hypothetical protein